MAFIRHKWIHFGCYAYFLALVLYCAFAASLTACVLLTPAPYSVMQIGRHSDSRMNE